MGTMNKITRKFVDSIRVLEMSIKTPLIKYEADHLKIKDYMRQIKRQCRQTGFMYRSVLSHVRNTLD